jgi:transposase-like protein
MRVCVRKSVDTSEVSEDDAILRLEGPRPWVWTAIDPVSKLLLAMEVGPRTVEMAQRVVPQGMSG